jgi:predicted transcriptional regulator
MIDGTFGVFISQGEFSHRAIQFIGLASEVVTQARRHRSRRTYLDIWAIILDFLITEEATLSKIVYSLKLNRAAANGYLQAMTTAGLIQMKQSRFVTYSITDSGVKWLKRYRGLVKDAHDKKDDDRPDFVP